MKKLKLTVDELQVESFPTGGDDAMTRGTVHGNASDSTCDERRCECTNDTEWDITCGTCNILVETCANTCPTHFYCPTVNGYEGC